MNGFQKRLVHQLIYCDFPDIVSLSKHDFVQLLPYDKAREEALQGRKDFHFEQNLAGQIGLRWIAEALCPTVNDVLPHHDTPPYAGGDLATIHGWINPPKQASDVEREVNSSNVSEILAQLSGKLTVLVGHK